MQIMNKLTFQDAKLEIVVVSRIIKVIVVATARKLSLGRHSKGNQDALESPANRLLGHKSPRELSRKDGNVRLQHVIYV